jgi:signal transduction histidine kinase
MMSQSEFTPSPLEHFSTDVLENADRESLLRLIRAVVHVGGIMDGVYNQAQILELILRESERAVDAETSSLLLYDAETHELTFEVALGIRADEVKKHRLLIDENSIAGAAAMTRSPVNVPDVRYDPRWNWTLDEQTRFLTQSILAVPMLRQDRLIGVLEVLNKKEENGFSSQDTNILLVLASLAAMAIDNAQLYQRNLQAERLGALGQAVAGVSHYIKNILSGLEGSVAVIDSAVKNGDLSMLDRSHDVLKRSVVRISDLVRNMLSYSKERKPEVTLTDPNQVLLEICDLVAVSPNCKGIEIIPELDASIGNRHLDHELLERVVLNLVTNAVDAIQMKRSEDTDVEGKVYVRSRFIMGVLSVTVEDNGIGIAEWEIPKIWGPFYTTKGASGTGLGLAVSKKLTEEAGGSLRVVSTPGEGSVFTLNISVQSPA